MVEGLLTPATLTDDFCGLFHFLGLTKDVIASFNILNIPWSRIIREEISLPRRNEMFPRLPSDPNVPHTVH
jgi:hypothetical protein